MNEPTIISGAVRDALIDVRRIKAPTKRAARIAAVLVELPTQAEAEHFVRLLRREAGVQDPALLPETTWTLTGFVDHGVPREGGTVATTAELVELLGHSVSIDWPSVTFHWGVAVRWTTEPEGRGVEWVARSADWRLTETYLSS